MKRNTSALAEKEYDLVVVGGGIFGICAAWDATLRGLSVALIEKGDFCGATSANCFKIVHGGVRYVQHADVKRVRESSRERTILLKIAPHLVDPLPIVVPTYGNGMKGKHVLRAGTAIYDALTFDRNRGVDDPEKKVPNSGSMSPDEALERFPGLDRDGLTGGTIIYDGHMYSPPRLAFSFLMSAAREGAEVANYVEAKGFLRNGDDITGVSARDLLTDQDFQIRGKVVLNAAGAWTEPLLRNDQNINVDPSMVFSRDAAIVVNRRLLDDRYGIAVQSRMKDPDAKLSRGARHLFMIPWREYTQIGVWHIVYRGHPDQFTVTEEEVQEFLDNINDGYRLDDPLTMRDVTMWNAGLVLFGENKDVKGDLSFGKRSRIVDHVKEHGVNNLVSMVGVRYTTARGVSEKAISLVFDKLGRNAPDPTTASTTLYGGNIEDYGSFMRDNIRTHSDRISPDAMHGVLRNYGSEFRDAMKHIDADPSMADSIEQTTTIKAQVVQSAREEMAVKLGDVLFRRTDMGTGEYPGEQALQICANLMAHELGWNDNRIKQEIDEAKAAFPSFLRKEAAASL